MIQLEKTKVKKMNKYLFLLITLSFSIISNVHAQSFENRGEVYNFTKVSEKTSYISLFETNAENFEEHDYFYDVSLLLNSRCTPTMLQIYFSDLEKEINPENKNDRATVKIGNRSFSSDIYTFVRNKVFFVDIPSNIIYSLNFSGDFELTMDFRQSDLKATVNFSLNQEERNNVISKIRNCKPS